MVLTNDCTVCMCVLTVLTGTECLSNEVSTNGVLKKSKSRTWSIYKLNNVKEMVSKDTDQGRHCSLWHPRAEITFKRKYLKQTSRLSRELLQLNFPPDSCDFEGYCLFNNKKGKIII